MKALRERLEQLRERIDGLSLRERLLVFLAVAAVVVFLWNQLFMQPLLAQRDRTQTEIAETRDRIAETNETLAEVLAEADRDPDAENRERLAELESEIADLDAEIEEITGELIDPRRMAEVLERILAREEGLELIRVESLSPRPLLDEADTEGLGNVYRHGMRLEFRGGYMDILRYLRRLEAMDSRLFWSELEIITEQHPRNRVVLQVHTLSLEEDWIGV